MEACGIGIGTLVSCVSECCLQQLVVTTLLIGASVESYIYMPLLEETGYMPKHKYSYGPELRAHAERIAQRWNLRDRTIFRQQVTKMAWDSNQKQWIIKTKFM
jgi:cation diffusion facilitator CzcD-associated flavoprotein CzcO